MIYAMHDTTKPEKPSYHHHIMSNQILNTVQSVFQCPCHSRNLPRGPDDQDIV